MKRLMFIFLLIGSVTYGQSPLVITGAYRSCGVYRNGLVWNTVRSTESGDGYTQNPASYQVANTRNLGVYAIARAGVMFDVSSLPSGSVIDSVKLKLYCTPGFGSDVKGLAIMNAWSMECGTYTLTDYSACQPIPPKILTHKTSTASGYNTYNVNAIPPVTGLSNIAGYMIIGYDYDYLNTSPTGDDLEIYVNLSSETNKPELTIYYSSAPVPSTKKIKIIGII